MSEEVLKRDPNHVTVLGGITDDSNQYVTMLRVDPTTKRLLVSATGSGVGTVTSVSVVSANGFAGSVATATTTPAITISTTINSPVLAGNGTAISAATTTGSGSTVVLATSPVLTTPNIGVATATSINGLTITSSTGTITITNGKVLSVTNTLTLSGTDSTVMTFPTTTATIARTDTSQTFSANQIFDTSITNPIYIGGTGTTSTITYRTTSNAGGTTGADHIWQSGNNGATELMRLLNAGRLGLGIAAPVTSLDIQATTPTENVGKTIKLGDRTYLTQLTVSNSTYLTNNLYFDGTDWRTKVNATGSLLNVTTGNMSSYYGTNGGVDGVSTLEQTFIVDGPLGSTVCGKQAALATNATTGFLWIPTSADAPTGVPQSFTGKVAMEYDTTNNKLYVYNGSWKSVTLS